LLGGQETIQALPRQYRITFGAAPIRSWGGMMIPALSKPVFAPSGAHRIGPAWFRALDRNRDGIVSVREFLGPPEAFRQLDGDNDGLITAKEATASVAP